MKGTYFDLRKELKQRLSNACLSQRFIVISIEPEAKDGPFDSAEVIAEANNDCALMEEIQKSIAKVRQQLGIPVGKDLQCHWFENNRLPHGYGCPNRALILMAGCVRHQGPFRPDTEST